MAGESASPTLLLFCKSLPVHSSLSFHEGRSIAFVLYEIRLFFNNKRYFVLPKEYLYSVHQKHLTVSEI